MERTELEKALQQAETQVSRLAQQLKEANREMEMLSYSVSHDLRAPLRAIKGFAEALQEDYRSRLDADGQRYLEIISTSTNQIYALMDGLLNFSRLGRQEMNPEEIDVLDLVRGLVNELKGKYPGRKIEFHLAELPKVKADAALLRQVWFHLLDNAMKFTAPRETAVIQIGGQKEEQTTAYFVKDNGVGFDMKYSEKLFALFQRFHTEKEFSGVGVGLAIAQRLIRRHDGKIWADAKVNAGATLHFSLPNK